jgi:hypothetical protein
MPGVILTIDTTVGTSVKRGETLMVLEAMKMKNELKRLQGRGRRRDLRGRGPAGEVRRDPGEVRGLI